MKWFQEIVEKSYPSLHKSSEEESLRYSRSPFFFRAVKNFFRPMVWSSLEKRTQNWLRFKWGM